MKKIILLLISSIFLVLAFQNDKQLESQGEKERNASPFRFKRGVFRPNYMPAARARKWKPFSYGKKKKTTSIKFLKDSNENVNSKYSKNSKLVIPKIENVRDSNRLIKKPKFGNKWKMSKAWNKNTKIVYPKQNNKSNSGLADPNTPRVGHLKTKATFPKPKRLFEKPKHWFKSSKRKSSLANASSSRRKAPRYRHNKVKKMNRLFKKSWGARKKSRFFDADFGSRRGLFRNRRWH